MCPACTVGLHEECFAPIMLGEEDDGFANCCCWTEVDVELAERIIGESMPLPDVPDANAPVEKLRDIPVDDRNNMALRDPVSAGRKRAAQLKPILDGMECEWAGLKFAGGGPIPIVGCRGNTLVRAKGQGVRTGNIHHGPNKSVLLNTDENLHRICSQCHNRWHELNDQFYPVERPDHGADFIPEGELTPHDKRTVASEEEIQYSEAWWGLPPVARKSLPFRKEVA